MVIEALQSYAQLASGLTKTTREKAVATAKALLDQAGLGEVASDASDRVSKLADELIATSKANRQLLTMFVDAEVQKAVGRLGLAKADAIEELRAEIADLRAANTAASASSAPATAPVSAPVSPPAGEPASGGAPPAAKRPAKKAPAKKAAVKKTAAKTTPAKRPAKKTAPKPTDEPATDAS